jgi:hypothetical protein
MERRPAYLYRYCQHRINPLFEFKIYLRSPRCTISRLWRRIVRTLYGEDADHLRYAVELSLCRVLLGLCEDAVGGVDNNFDDAV